ncbi:putative zinc metalloprotease [Thermoclostridium stercorarium subsp. stercorarium DSM 8532]|jgi:Zn-dependent protease|uniref:Peptidase n=3 Tax=Thermoclostridium stercorarium TaxID=1510 RepID=A0A1B1YIG0_THEST|nr:site-2 protease family protein [Thermoclostridium stercorarium]AGC67575.1 putative zinc metalloprotease [Thermoclostridium stercorarium subsp. stercorarium DSM 8532]AGI38624.1 protease [Thermoclostridium stercorarium subsp. stercorarium DSM 8532]ANW97997.1 peptidase [Thermoclostridium stercorarium subsp. thermolacticum DSM 2910]ANX00546.1 peptidase [Thermoclostridium stercorarium subsp. leptospartum DSM 9219]UZQ86159.1 site-2 protease family protein [Thermoclostridium stercorarium]
MFRGNLSDYLLMVPVLLISLTVHEFAHGYTAYRLGDPTAKNEGRLSLNPFRHLDPIGTIMMIVARIGWAKPVPINPAYFRDRKRGTMLVSFAGPLSNLAMAFIGVFLYKITYVISYSSIIAGDAFATYFMSFLLLFFTVNINLAIFNLLPVPPLDGSKILYGVLPYDKYFRYMQYERYVGMIFLVIVLAFPSALSTVISFFTQPIAKSMIWCVDLIIGLFL